MITRRAFLFTPLVVISACTPSDPKERLVAEAAGKLRQEAYFASRVDWEGAEAHARLLMKEGRDTKDAITYLVAQLKDGHSFYISKAQADRALGNSSVENLGVEHATYGRIEYLKIPSFAGNVEARMAAYANEIRRPIARRGRWSPCGWIVDLRSNSGGNMGPMLAGLQPFLGDGALGHFVGLDRRTALKATALDSILPLEPVDATNAPVAVLVGPNTASSGEAVFVSFIGRPRTRTFGQPTAGKSSGNRGVRLSDGSMLLITSALLADRNGRVYGGRISPDETVETSAAIDAPLRRAIEWLEGGCG
jgi:carboxyl-terminal processing protease